MNTKPRGYVEPPTYPHLPATHAGGPTENEPYKGDSDNVERSTTTDGMGRVKMTTESGRTKVPADTSAEYDEEQARKRDEADKKKKNDKQG